jgi:hypothetical protein
MSRVRLTDAEREQRLRERVRASFGESAYRHYDASNGFGSRRDWMDAAEALAGGRGAFTPDLDGLSVADRTALRTLGIDFLPADAQALKSAFRAASLRTHPDVGGSEAAFRAVYAAYERLIRLCKVAA